MSTESRLVDVCDLRNGRITFNEDLGDTSVPENYRVLVMDKNNREQVIPAERRPQSLELSINNDIRPLRRLEITDGAGKSLYVLNNLFPSTNEEFETQFKSARDRSGDPYIDQFVATQIFSHFTGENGYRISAAVVAAYKAMELLDYDLLDAAENMLLRSLSVLPSIKMARSARNNREHLHVSLLCTLYHVHLAQGRPRDFLRTLLTLESLLREHTFQSYYNLAYNACLSLRLLTVLYRRAGLDKEGRQVSLLTFELFKLSVRDADENMAHFKELGYVHANTYDAMRIGRRMKEVSASFAEKTIRSCLRISAPDHPESFQKMLETFIETTELLRPGSAG